MTRPARVGIVGCGVISKQYARSADAFDSFRIVACADAESASAERLAADHNLLSATLDELLSSPEIDVVLNLTPPLAHVDITRQAMDAGKHVYSEKPLAPTAVEAGELLDIARARGVRIGCAPDTFLGSGFQAARRAIDDGAIGEPISVSAAMLVGGQTQWHPNADIFYAAGAGPLFDMGPYYLTALVALLGPVHRVTGFASTHVLERTIEIGPRAGIRFAAETPTHTASVLELDGGVTASLVASFEAPGQYVCDFVVHGTTGVLVLPDPNSFDRTVRIRSGRGDWRDLAVVSAGARDARGIGLDDLAVSLASGSPHRASGELGCHVVDVAWTILAAAAEGCSLDVASTVERPSPLDAAGAAREIRLGR
jgi:predicted dehydrogenase